MVTDELIIDIREKFREGKRRNEIKEELMQRGISEEDVDAAIAKIQHDVVKQLPGIAWIYKRIGHLESKANLTSLKMTILLMISCVAVLFILAGILYFAFDPLGTRIGARDVQRQNDAIVIQNALNAYYQKNQQYPSALDNLMPSFVSSLPHDPQSSAGYSYKMLDKGKNYELCISFEIQQAQCINPTPVSSDIPVVPTETPIPEFTPASGSGSFNAL
ncbi:MAG TPA: hypothetical protein VNW29_01715 [Candidatus Sulfotelmatobacter sp.]|jgi:hypothetical protein|nr:hypothetical protein [Candidatus Sulfotelmatobacter sp.]